MKRMGYEFFQIVDPFSAHTTLIVDALFFLNDCPKLLLHVIAFHYNETPGLLTQLSEFSHSSPEIKDNYLSISARRSGMRDPNEIFNNRLRKRPA
jgi:hypothetical protein